MDNRTQETAAATTEKHNNDVCVLVLTAVKTYHVVVLGREQLPPIEAVNAEERGHKMARAGIDLIEDKWAAGYLDDNRQLQMCGNNAEARKQLRELLRRH